MKTTCIQTVFLTINGLGQGQIQRHQHDRPIDGVEADDVLAHQVQICRPVAIHQLGFVVEIAQCDRDRKSVV